jgi:drug/metabolite transporter superfamily protein YnfA
VTPQPDLLLPLALFVLFALLSVVGAYLALLFLRGRKAAVLAAIVTAVFFGILLVSLLGMMRNAGLV